MTLRLDLDAVDAALRGVEHDWSRIAAGLQLLKIGDKSPFTVQTRRRILSAYAYLDELVAQDVEPFSDPGMEHMLELNRRIHFGDDGALATQFASLIDVTIDRFNAGIVPIADRYWRQRRHGEHAYKLAAESYVGVVGQPQLFVEGNHRTGVLIGSWIDLRADCAPFVLSAQNALPYFELSSRIKQFADTSTWRGRMQLKHYRGLFTCFWEKHVDASYCRAA